MIGRLTGRIIECNPAEVLLDVGGVGYALHIPLSTYYGLAGVNGSVSLHVHTYVREDSLQLFGFGTAGERESFERLIAISGVGPRIALAVLSGIGADDLQRAVNEQDSDRLTRIPGIGRKTAERILLELRDRPGSARAHRRPAEDGGPPRQSDARPDPRQDGISALMNLGYSRDVARKAVDGALAELGEASGLEHVLREALRRLVR